MGKVKKIKKKKVVKLLGYNRKNKPYAFMIKPGYSIWDLDKHRPLFSDGEDWYDSMGNKVK